MNRQTYQKAGDLFKQLRYKQAELELVEHLVSNIQGATAKVKINSQWIIDLPVAALRGHAQVRKIQLEQEIATLENELNML